MTDKDIFSATQRAAANERGRAIDFSKRSSKVNRLVSKPAGSESDCSDRENSKCDPESSKVISKLTKALSAVTGQLAALRKDIDLSKTQGYNPVSFAPNRYGSKPMISSTSDIHLRCGGCKNMRSNCKFDFKIYGNCKVAFYCSKKVNLVLGITTKTYSRPLTIWSNNILSTY